MPSRRPKETEYDDGSLCRHMLPIEWTADFRPEPHACTLPARHYGEHLCWCGCLFFKGQVRAWQIPLSDDSTVEIQEIGPYKLVHHVERP